MTKYVLLHTWNYKNGSCGSYEVSFFDFDEAMNRFIYLQFLMENDDYDFNAIIPEYKKGDTFYSVYEDMDSDINRQNLCIKKVEVSL